jgi:hypothetical protein
LKEREEAKKEEEEATSPSPRGRRKSKQLFRRASGAACPPTASSSTTAGSPLAVRRVEAVAFVSIAAASLAVFALPSSRKDCRRRPERVMRRVVASLHFQLSSIATKVVSTFFSSPNNNSSLPLLLLLSSYTASSFLFLTHPSHQPTHRQLSPCSLPPSSPSSLVPLPSSVRPTSTPTTSPTPLSRTSSASPVLPAVAGEAGEVVIEKLKEGPARGDGVELGARATCQRVSGALGVLPAQQRSLWRSWSTCSETGFPRTTFSCRKRVESVQRTIRRFSSIVDTVHQHWTFRPVEAAHADIFFPPRFSPVPAATTTAPSTALPLPPTARPSSSSLSMTSASGLLPRVRPCQSPSSSKLTDDSSSSLLLRSWSHHR